MLLRVWRLFAPALSFLNDREVDGRGKTARMNGGDDGAHNMMYS